MPDRRSALPEVKTWAPVELIRWTGDYLTEKAVEEPRLNAELLLASVLGVKRLDLYLQFDRPLMAEELAEFKARLRRRLRGEPLQYIEGSAQFRNLRLTVDPRALIPRPETELLVGEVLTWAGDREGLDVADIGTGSGAIALALRQEGRFGRLVATDLSPAALALARENHQRCLPASEIEFRLGAGLQPLGGESFDVIVSNPPYVGLAERPTLAEEVREWEPPMALFSGDDGLDLIRQLVGSAPDHLNPGGLLALEIGAGQAAEVAALVRENPSLERPLVRKDFAGRDRIVLAHATTVAPGLR